jgi:hypothetical protein
MKKLSSLLIALSFLFLIVNTGFGQTEKSDLIPAKDFLSNLRSSYRVGTWVDMRGNIDHKRRLKSGNYKSAQAKIKVSILYTKLQAVAMIKLAEKDLNSTDNEIYKVGQPYSGDPASIIASNLQDASMIGDFGISPGDFAMTFLFWDLANVDQNQIDSVKGLKCRILNLINPNTKGTVKIYASIDYLFPLKVEWFKPEQTAPYRTMVIESFKLEDNLGAPNDFLITGPGWKTRVNFDNVKLGYKNPKVDKTGKIDKNKEAGVPKDLFE